MSSKKRDGHKAAKMKRGRQIKTKVSKFRKHHWCATQGPEKEKNNEKRTFASGKVQARKRGKAKGNQDQEQELGKKRNDLRIRPNSHAGKKNNERRENQLRKTLQKGGCGGNAMSKISYGKGDETFDRPSPTLLRSRPEKKRNRKKH